ncbi:MAG: ECF transporter S component [Anaerolineaceae bacterium]|nr:ECF transporter S component [Anaerolineaceae bacterium]
MANKFKLDRLSLFLIPIGIAVNFIGGQIAILLKLPLYLDAIGTIVVGALCGVWPGILVGLISNVLNSISSPITLFYAILNILFGITAAYLSKRGVFKSFWKTLVSALLFALIGGGLGALMTWVLYGFDFGAGVSSMFAIPLHEGLGLPKFLAQLIAEFSMDVFDKVLTVIAAFGILHAIPTRFLSKLPLGRIYIKDEDLALEESED